MAVNAATSSYVNNASSSKGFSGLASGVDTESMVEQMLAGTQAKIDKQEGVKQQLQWKQEIYRNIITQINAFQSKFFSYSSATNLSSSSFWNSLSVLANSSAFKATATSSASTGTSSIAVRRLATKASLTSGMSVSGNLSGEIDTDALKKLTDEQLTGDYTVKFKVGEDTVDVDLKDVFVSEDGKSFVSYNTTSALDRAIQKKLQTAFDAAETKVKVTVEDGAITMTHTDFSSYAKKISVSDESGALGLARLGLNPNVGSTKTSEKNDKTNIETVTYTLTSQVDATPKMEFTVTLDDLKKTVSVDLSKVLNAETGEIDKDAFKSQLESALAKAHGAGQIKITQPATGGFNLEVSAGRKLDIGGAEDVLAALGLKNGASNRINLSSKLSELNLGTPLQGDEYRFTINGVEFHFKEDTAIIDVMDVINRSDAGVRMVYRAQDDKFVLEAKEYGAGKQLELGQSEGNLLTALFGTGAGVTTSGRANSGRLQGYEVKDLKGIKFVMTKTEDGEEVPLSADEAKLVPLADLRYIKEYKTEEKDGEEVEVPVYGTLGDLAKELYGDDGTVKDLFPELFKEGSTLDPTTATLGDLADAKTAGNSLYYSYTLDDDGNLTLKHNVTEETTLDEMGYTLAGIDGDVTLGQLKDLTDGKLYYDSQFLFLEGYYAETADAATTATLDSIFGKGYGVGRDPGTFEVVDGQNSEVMIDGIVTERASNNFTVNGINYDITALTGSYSAATRAFREVTGDDDTGWSDADGNPIDGLTSADLVQTEDGKWIQYLDYYLDENGEIIDPKDLVEVDGVMQKFTGSSETVTVKQDTDAIIDGLKEFIDEYNKLVKTLNDLLDEDTNYRDYAPLTSAQKAEMSDREIELWEKKAKEGLLHRDSTIQDFLQQMRTALYQKPAGAKYALYELGIETGEWEMKGQLTFTVNGEANIRNLLENDPSGVASLFTGVNGLGNALNDILKSTASTSSGSPGTLVQIAGLKDSDTTSSMYNQLKKIDDKIEALKRQYEMEKTRYWNQFNTMEQMISNMNTQSAYLAQMMGMSY